MMRDYRLRLCFGLLLLLCLSLAGCSPSSPSHPGSGKASGPPPAYEGYVDEVTCVSIIAWAWDSTRPDEPIKVDIYDGGTLIDTVNAEHFRQDLLNAGKGNGKHYFIWPTSIQLKDGKPHTIALKFAGTALEVGPPKPLTCNLEQ